MIKVNNVSIETLKGRKFIENVCDTIYSLDENGLHSVALSYDL